MRIVSWRASVACLSLFVSATSFAGLVSITVYSSGAFPPEARTVEGGRDVQVVVSQAEIKPNIHISSITSATGGGLLFAAIDAGVNNARAKDAELAIVPLRESLVGYDFDPRVQLASSNLLTGLGWFDPKQQKFSKDELTGFHPGGGRRCRYLATDGVELYVRDQCRFFGARGHHERHAGQQGRATGQEA